MTKQSPRMTVNGIIKWYHGNCFDLDLLLDLTKDGQPFNLATGDKIQVHWYKQEPYLEDELAYTFEYTQGQTATTTQLVTSSNGTSIRLKFTPTVSSKFKPGYYHYCIIYVDHTNSYTTTIAAGRKAVVEQCH